MKNLFRLKWNITVSLCLTVVCTQSIAQAQTNIAVGVPSGATRNDTYPAAGIGFYAPASVGTTVNALGFWDATGAGLQTSHQVSLYQYNGANYTLLATVVVPAGTVAPLINGYRWVGIPSITLPDNGQGGNYYAILASQGSDTWAVGISNSPDMNPAIGTISTSALWFTPTSQTLSDPTVNMNSTLTIDGYGGPNVGYFNPPLQALGLPIIITNIQPAGIAVPVGGTAVFTVVLSNSPPANLQWQYIANGFTNNINNGVVNVTNNGEVFTTLTLTNLQATNSGSYVQVEAVNPTNSLANIYSDAASLSVNGLIQWIQSGTFTGDSVLAVAGNPTNEVYGVYFGGVGSLSSANGYTFDDYLSGTPNMALTTGYGTYASYLTTNTPSTGDGSFDLMLTTGAYGQGIGGTLENLTVGRTYYVLVLMADTRGSAAGGSVFHSSDGVTVSTGQQYAFANGSPAIGGYMLGRFTAVSTTQPMNVFNTWPYANQYNCVLVENTQAVTNNGAPIYLISDTLPASATVGVGGQVSFSASFGYSPPLNLQWRAVTNGVTNTISSGVVNTTNGAIVTSTLTMSNIAASAAGNYRVEAIDATNSLNFIYSSFATLTVIPVTTWIGSGVFSNNAVLALVGPASNVVYAVDFGGSGHQVTANGYTFDDYLTHGDMSLAGGSDYGGYMSGGATTGDGALDAVLTYGAYGSGVGGTLNNLTPGQAYKVLVLLDDTRGSAAGGDYFIVTDGINTSPAQQYAFTNGVPYVGGYILGSFTANSSTQPFTIATSYSGAANTYYAPQYNAVIVAKAPVTPTVPVLAAPRIVGGNLILTGTSGTPGSPYTWLQTTNLTSPVIWTTNITGTLDGTGSLSNSISLNAGQSGCVFLRLRLP